MTYQDGFETLAIHAGQEPDPVTGAVVPPIYQVSTYKQDGVGGLRGGYEYSRSANPTRTALEQCLTALESAAHANVAHGSVVAHDDLQDYFPFEPAPPRIVCVGRFDFTQQ